NDTDFRGHRRRAGHCWRPGRGAAGDMKTMSKGSGEWNAESYHRVSDPQFSWALKVLQRVQVTGDETVLDAGCGSGRVTAELAQRLPHGRVAGVDYSQNMLL